MMVATSGPAGIEAAEGALPCGRNANAAQGACKWSGAVGGEMKSVGVERPAVNAILAGEKRGMLIAYLSYALKDVRTMDLRAYQLLQLTIESLGGDDEDMARAH
jgi:hypothetical protein